MFTHILVPLDGSARAEAALEYGSKLAKQAGGKLTLLRVISLVPEGLSGQDVIDQIRSRQAKTAQEYLQAAAQKAGVSAEVIVLPGDAARTILNFAREKDVDTIVLNSHGAGGISGYVFGSVAEKVVHGAECPVLVLHERPTPEELRAQEEREEAEFDAMLAASLSSAAEKRR